MTARITPPSSDPATTGRPALNRAARRARRKGADPAPATGVPVTPHGTVSTKPVRHRTDYAARRSG